MGQSCGCGGQTVNNNDTNRDCREHGAKIGDDRIVERVFHLFNRHDVRGVALKAESHPAIHTWPECGYGASDFTCGEVCRPVEGLRVSGGEAWRRARLREGDEGGVNGISQAKRSPANLLDTKEFGRWPK